MRGAYLVPGRDGLAEVEVSRSRFLARVARAGDEAAARAVVAEQRRRHADARHHCSAFVVGPPGDAGVERSSDDGEPPGTAGAPMLEVLRGAGDPAAGEELRDVVAVVTRWFGGTLLGAGGLVRAYGDAVRAALAEAGTRRLVLLREVVVEVDHADAGRVETAVRGDGVVVLDRAFGQRAALRLGVPGGGEDAVGALLAGLTAGRAVPVVVGERWTDA